MSDFEHMNTSLYLTDVEMSRSEGDTVDFFMRSPRQAGASRQDTVQSSHTMRPEIKSNDFGRFKELASRFEFEFRRCENCIFEQFEFLVCSNFNHMQRDCTCACAVACLYPHN